MIQGFLLPKWTWYYCNRPLGILYRKRVFIFQVQSESSPRSLDFFFFFKLTEYNIWWLYFSVMEYYYTTNGNVITPFPYACFSSWGSKDIIKSGNERINVWQELSKCSAELSWDYSWLTALQHSMYLVAFFSEKCVVHFSCPSSTCPVS